MSRPFYPYGRDRRRARALRAFRKQMQAQSDAEGEKVAAALRRMFGPPEEPKKEIVQ